MTVSLEDLIDKGREKTHEVSDIYHAASDQSLNCCPVITVLRKCLQTSSIGGLQKQSNELKISVSSDPRVVRSGGCSRQMTGRVIKQASCFTRVSGRYRSNLRATAATAQ